MTMKELSDNALKALWCALDEDNSGTISIGELHAVAGTTGKIDPQRGSVLLDGVDPAQVKGEVAALREGFTDVQYCF